MTDIFDDKDLISKTAESQNSVFHTKKQKKTRDVFVKHYVANNTFVPTKCQS